MTESKFSANKTVEIKSSSRKTKQNTEILKQSKQDTNKIISEADSSRLNKNLNLRQPRTRKKSTGSNIYTFMEPPKTKRRSSVSSEEHSRISTSSKRGKRKLYNPKDPFANFTDDDSKLSEKTRDLSQTDTNKITLLKDSKFDSIEPVIGECASSPKITFFNEINDQRKSVNQNIGRSNLEQQQHSQDSVFDALVPVTKKRIKSVPSGRSRRASSKPGTKKLKAMTNTPTYEDLFGPADPFTPSASSTPSSRNNRRRTSVQNKLIGLSNISSFSSSDDIPLSVQKNSLKSKTQRKNLISKSRNLESLKGKKTKINIESDTFNTILDADASFVQEEGKLFLISHNN